MFNFFKAFGSFSSLHNRSNDNIHKIDAKQRHFLDKDCGVRVIFLNIFLIFFYICVSVNNLIQGWLPRMNFYRQDFSEADSE